MKTKKTGLLVSALALGMLFACSKNEEVSSENAQLGAIEQPSVLNKQCSFVDNNWSSTSVLSSTVVNASETSFIRNENSKIAALWGQSVVALSFVVDPSNPGSTYNAISYGSNPRKIYYGEAIYKAALAKGRLVCSMILAHEFGHQLQYNYGLPSVRENTSRPNELEADGFAGYYLRKPAGYNAASFAAIAAGSDFAFAIGDYQTTSQGHHGTPPQRRSAVRLGFLLAAPANGNLTASSFDSNFFYYYNGVLNGTYKMARPANISDEMDAFMQAHMEELRQIQSGEISKEEFKQLGDN
jgi:uncharacterized protein